MSVKVGQRVKVDMPGLSHHERVGVLVEFMSKKIGKVRFGDGTVFLFPLNKLR